MTKKSKAISLAAIEKIIKKSGAERVSDQAKEQLRDILEEIGEEISERALKLAIHTGRKTVKPEDIKLARK